MDTLRTRMTANLEAAVAELEALKAKALALTALVETRRAEIADMEQGPFAAVLDHPVETLVSWIRKWAPHVFSHHVAVPAAAADVPTLTEAVSPAAPIDALMEQVTEARAPG